jgi:hypothetical protein
MLTDERIKQMRADAISDPRNAQEFWYMLMARAIESEATAPLLARIADLEQAVKWESDLCQQALDSRAELEADAKRYLTIRNADMDLRNRIEHYSGPALDVFIDNAMKEQP